jgi:hypothetical protein
VKEIVAGVLRPGEEVPVISRIAGDEESVRRLIGRFPERRLLSACYEQRLDRPFHMNIRVVLARDVPREERYWAGRFRRRAVGFVFQDLAWEWHSATIIRSADQPDQDGLRGFAGAWSTAGLVTGPTGWPPRLEPSRTRRAPQPALSYRLSGDTAGCSDLAIVGADVGRHSAPLAWPIN